jgi:uncharacterized membrane protein YccF (DUF307 family)
LAAARFAVAADITVISIAVAGAPVATQNFRLSQIAKFCAALPIDQHIPRRYIAAKKGHKFKRN